MVLRYRKLKLPFDSNIDNAYREQMRRARERRRETNRGGNGKEREAIERNEGEDRGIGTPWFPRELCKRIGRRYARGKPKR